MIIEFLHGDQKYITDLSKEIDISMAIDDKRVGPNCFFAARPEFTPVRVGDFVGSVKDGGSVNYYDIKFNPHGNGTHTECKGHITPGWDKINTHHRLSHMVARLITVLPKNEEEDRIILKEQLSGLMNKGQEKALIIRTLPNSHEEKYTDHSGKNPPYLSIEAMQYIVECGIEHLLIDLPSVDRESDEGKLSAHKTFWALPEPDNRSHCTITEMVYVDNKVLDGLYLLDLQRAAFELDCAPSRPLLFNMTKKQQ